MKIAYLAGAYVPSRGANSMHVMCMSQAMASLGNEVTLYVRPGDLDSDDDFDFYNVSPSFVLSKLSRPQIRVWGALVNAVRTRRAVAEGGRLDLIYAREVWALSLVADLGVPFIFESHWLPNNAIQKAAEARLFRHPSFRRVVFISEALRRMYLDIYPWLDPKATLVAHDAANISTPSMEQPIVGFGRKSALQIGYVGSFQVGSGVDLIAKTAALLPNEDFHVFGGSPSEVGSWLELTSELKNLHFHGFVEPNRLPDIYKSLDVLLAPYQATTRSIGWASPMKLFEYMAFRKAIVCSDFPVLREVLEQGVTGILVQADCAEEWARAIEKLRDNRELRQQLGDSGYELLERHYTWHGRAESVLKGVFENSNALTGD